MPGVDDLDDTLRAMREWHVEGMPVQLHPGDLGWNWQYGPEALAVELRTWHRDGTVIAVGLLDSPTLLRMAIAPQVEHDEAFAEQFFSDVSQPERGVLPEGEAVIEARFGDLVRSRLLGHGWVLDEPWTPLHRDLTEPIAACTLRIEIVGPERADARAAVQRASFVNSTFSVERWTAMTAGAPYESARCLLGYDDEGTAVAVATVWSAGPGRPGLLEPMGVHHDHRGRGYGRAINLAAAAALRDMGASSITVCTTSSNTAAVATYESAGFRRLPQVPDLRRPA